MLKEILKGYNFLGIRTTADDENYSIGDTCRCSYDWDYENDCSTYNTDEPIELNGACAIEVLLEDLDEMAEEEIENKINSITCNYVGEQTILIGGHVAEYGADENEIIISDAIVLKVIN